jgi:hypothetical protein
MYDSPNENNFISGIHNYCDRWCERCHFTGRCSVFAEEQDYVDEGGSFDIESVVEKLTTVFAETKQLLIEKADELGIDPFDFDEKEFEEVRKREKQFVDNDELSHLAESYWRSAREILEVNNEWLEDLESEDKIAADVIAVIRWYYFFIAAKVNRGLRGLLDDEGYEDGEQARDTQSDANGAVKIGLIAIDRSILAWTYLLDSRESGTISPMIELLEQMKGLLEKRFPLARNFVRPGFDEIEAVM